MHFDHTPKVKELQAKLLAGQIEEEVGLKIVDVELRAFYVRLCAGIWSVGARQGDPDAARRYAVYTNALEQIYAFR